MSLQLLNCLLFYSVLSVTDTVQTVPAKDYTTTKSMYTCTYVDKLLNMSLYE